MGINKKRTQYHTFTSQQMTRSQFYPSSSTPTPFPLLFISIPFLLLLLLSLTLTLSLPSPSSSFSRFNDSFLDSEIEMDDENSVSQMISSSRRTGSLEYQKWGFILYSPTDDVALKEWRRIIFPKWKKIRQKQQNITMDEMIKYREIIQNKKDSTPTSTSPSRPSPLPSHPVANYIKLKTSILIPTIPSIDLTEVIREDAVWNRELTKHKSSPSSRFSPRRLVVDDETNPSTLIDSTDLHKLYRCDIIQLAAAKGFLHTIKEIFSQIEGDEGEIVNQSVYPPSYHYSYVWSRNCKLSSLVHMSHISPIHLLTLFSPPNDEKYVELADFFIHRTDQNISDAKREIEKRNENITKNGEVMLSHHADSDNENVPPTSNNFSSLTLTELYDYYTNHNILYFRVSPADETALNMAADRGHSKLFQLYLNHTIPPLYQQDNRWLQYVELQNEEGSEEDFNDDGDVDADEETLAIRKQNREHHIRNNKSISSTAFEILPNGTHVHLPFESKLIPMEQRLWTDDRTNITYRVPPEFRVFRDMLHRSFHYAVMNGSVDIVNYILNNKYSLRININIRSHEGRGDAAIHGACMTNNAQFMQLFLHHGANIFLPTSREQWNLIELCENYDADETLKVVREWMKRKNIAEPKKKRVMNQDKEKEKGKGGEEDKGNEDAKVHEEL